VVHSRTKNAAEVVKRADIVVAAVGRAEMVRRRRRRRRRDVVVVVVVGVGVL